MRSFPVSLALLLFAVVTHPKPSNATLIANGSFEAMVIPHGYQVMHVGSTLIEPWEISRENVDLVGSYWQAADGTQSLDLNGSGGIGAVAQTFSTIVGQLYRVTFAMAANPDGCSIYTMAVAAAGSQAEFSADVCGTVTSMGWEDKSWDFIATAETTTLEFLSLSGSGESGPALDDVAVTPVPEPSVASLIMMGLVAIGFFCRARFASRCPTRRCS